MYELCVVSDGDLIVEVLETANGKIINSHDGLLGKLSEKMTKEKASLAILTVQQLGFIEYREYPKETTLEITSKGKKKLLKMEIKRLEKECFCNKPGELCGNCIAVNQLEKRVRELKS